MRSYFRVLDSAEEINPGLKFAAWSLSPPTSTTSTIKTTWVFFADKKAITSTFCNCCKSGLLLSCYNELVISFNIKNGISERAKSSYGSIFQPKSHIFPSWPPTTHNLLPNCCSHSSIWAWIYSNWVWKFTQIFWLLSTSPSKKSNLKKQKTLTQFFVAKEVQKKTLMCKLWGQSLELGSS